MQGIKRSLTSYWSGISLREQRMLVVALILCGIAVLYWGLLAPLQQKNEAALSRLNSEKQLLSWVRNEANAITQLRQSTGSVAPSSQPLNQLLSSSTRRFSIELIRLQPREEMVQVWIQPVAFNTLVEWLSYLRYEQGVEVAFLDITETEKPGLVDVKRLQFKRVGS